MTGRPSSFTDEIAAEICARLAHGDSLRTVCLKEEMPDRSTVFRWLETNAVFRDQYTRAKAFVADMDADEIVDIADGKYGANSEGIGEVTSDPVRDRLRVDARKWRASKLAPKKYGEKIAHVGGDEGDNPIRTAVDVSNLTPEQLRALASVRLPADA